MWQRVAKLSDIPADTCKTVQCAGPTFGLFNVKGKIFALDSSCPHRGAPLGDGSLDGHEVICPWHAWTFDVRTGECKTTPDIRQKTYPVKIEKDDILVDF